MLNKSILITAVLMVVFYTVWLDMVLLRGITSLLNASTDLEVLAGSTFILFTVIINVSSIVLVKKLIGELKL